MRVFLGAVEGPMFPGIVLYLSGFYTRKELSLRYIVSDVGCSAVDDSCIDHLELLYSSPQLR